MNMIKTLTAAVVASSLVLGGCQTMEDTFGGPRRSQEQKTLEKREKDLGMATLEGAVYGAAAGAAVGASIGALVGFAKADKGERGESALRTAKTGAKYGAAGGAVAGAFTGYANARGKQYVDDINRNQQLTTELEHEIAENEKAIAAAEIVVDRHKNRIAALRRQVSTGEATQAELDQEIKSAKEDLATLNGIIANNDKLIALTTEDIQKAPEGSDLRKVLTEKRDELRKNKRSLEAQVRILSDVEGVA